MLQFTLKQLLKTTKYNKIKSRIYLQQKMQNQIYKKVDNTYAIYKQQLGKGTYGVVMKAGLLDNPKAEMACKIIVKKQIQRQIEESPQQDKNKLKVYVVGRLKEEILVWKKVKHPNIVQFLGYSETSNNIYLFMEFCANGNLTDYINNNGAMSEQKAAPVIRDIINATAYLHSSHIIHRDIKAENVLLHNGRAMLADFGFAKLKDDTTVPDTGTGIGTLLYMAPQLINYTDHPRYSSKADCWSIGVLIYVLLFGIYPWGKVNQIIEFRIALKKQQIQIPKDVPISSGMRKLITGALMYEEEDRLSSEQMLIQINGIINSSNKMEVQ